MLEMMVVVAIVLMMTAIILNYLPDFRDKSSLDLVAQKIAINIRSAQVYASGGRVTAEFADGEIPSYGLVFKEDAPGFVLFANRGANPENDPMEEYVLEGVQIDEIFCDRDPGCSEIKIIYTRPSLEADICLDGDCEDMVSQADIIIRGGRSERRKIISVYKNGQISVQNED
jgi:type II secretory pathway pseudopilin PulG